MITNKLLDYVYDGEMAELMKYLITLGFSVEEARKIAERGLNWDAVLRDIAEKAKKA